MEKIKNSKTARAIRSHGDKEFKVKFSLTADEIARYILTACDDNLRYEDILSKLTDDRCKKFVKKGYDIMLDNVAVDDKLDTVDDYIREFWSWSYLDKRK